MIYIKADIILVINIIIKVVVIYYINIPDEKKKLFLL